MNKEKMNWNNLARRTSAIANTVKSPNVPHPDISSKLNEDKKRLSTHYSNLLDALKKAPIFLASVHGNYDLNKEPTSWIVPRNTYIFEAQTIRDATLSTNIDNPLWDLCLTQNREKFFNYFLGNSDKIRRPRSDFIEVFRNLILYKPGDAIYIRNCSIGGGREARRDYTNMGFYKFDKNTPPQSYPEPTTRRPMIPTEIAELDPMRTAMIEDDEFTITNKDFVNLVVKGTPIQYKGSYFKPPQNFTIKKGKEEMRIIIFSSAASHNCGAVAEKDKRHECYERLWKIARHQRNIALELLSMGIRSGPGGPGWLGLYRPNIVQNDRTRQEDIYPREEEYREKFSVTKLASRKRPRNGGRKTIKNKRGLLSQKHKN